MVMKFASKVRIQYLIPTLPATGAQNLYGLLQLLRTNRSHREVSLCVLAQLNQSFVKGSAALRIAYARIGAGGK